jgi:hypothetical protein
MHVPWAEDADGDDIPTHYSCLDLHGAHPYTLVESGRTTRPRRWRSGKAARVSPAQRRPRFRHCLRNPRTPAQCWLARCTITRSMDVEVVVEMTRLNDNYPRA